LLEQLLAEALTGEEEEDEIDLEDEDIDEQDEPLLFSSFDRRSS
jgi:hypothetical protein